MEIKSSGWTHEIRPQSGWFNIQLKEIWEYRDLISILVKRDIIALYKQTVLGPLWLFLGPLFTVVIYTFVFGQIAQISTEQIPAPLFYLAGVTLWNYFQSCFTATSTTFTSNAHIFGKVYFPRLVAPIAVIVSNLVKFGIQMLLFASMYLFYYFTQPGLLQPGIYIALLPLLILLMAGLALGLGIIISSMTTKYRDLSYFVSFGVTLLMYVTPVIYPMSEIPQGYAKYLAWNPLAPIIESFRFAVTGAGTFSWSGLGYSAAFMVVVLTFGIMIFSRVQKTFMDTV